MAITLEGAFTIPADKRIVWSGLNDPDVLRACIPGCHTLEKASDNEFFAIAKVKIGPMNTSIKGKVELRDVDAPNSCRLLGEGLGGIAGFAKGEADIRLTDVPEGTSVTYAVEANVGGKLAHLGGRFFDGMAKRMVDRFFARFVAVIAPDQSAA
ncbi:SRPBCC family protein [Lichenifustis flavocetrariae]|uniref:Carbon monoxide dehydrogenase subunit G n=1 Tax=Lichenifustis flavocetrariae TaxID=2949735 RepID=A0AA41YXX9_9HYPH|nr:carbon monoxide dehydrogenase subunit G [Lichenifustis flavocetrariae]MCW6509345.1 carbon monoxide dehydrogenase subunit G [Lichenifustis flavocetrariae]